jgi:hypothetical protein
MTRTSGCDGRFQISHPPIPTAQAAMAQIATRGRALLDSSGPVRSHAARAIAATSGSRLGRFVNFGTVFDGVTIVSGKAPLVARWNTLPINSRRSRNSKAVNACDNASSDSYTGEEAAAFDTTLAPMHSGSAAGSRSDSVAPTQWMASLTLRGPPVTRT